MPRPDNGPPFNSREFNDFSKHLGFAHRKVTPYCLRANGEVERFMRKIKKVIKAAVMVNKNWRQEMYKFLRNYRAPPPIRPQKSLQCTALFGRTLKTFLSQVAVESEQDQFNFNNCQAALHRIA